MGLDLNGKILPFLKYIFYSTSTTSHPSIFWFPSHLFSCSWVGLLSSTWPLSILPAWSFSPHLVLFSLWENSSTPRASLITYVPMTYTFNSSLVFSWSSQPIDPAAYWMSKSDFIIFFPKLDPFPRFLIPVASSSIHLTGASRTQEPSLPSASPLPNILPSPIGLISQISMETIHCLHLHHHHPAPSTIICRLHHCRSLLRGYSINAIIPPLKHLPHGSQSDLFKRMYLSCHSCLKSFTGFPQLLE